MLHEINLGIGVTVRYLEAETDSVNDTKKSLKGSGFSYGTSTYFLWN
jgi:hypothetical protein